MGLMSLKKNSQKGELKEWFNKVQVRQNVISTKLKFDNMSFLQLIFDIMSFDKFGILQLGFRHRNVASDGHLAEEDDVRQLVRGEVRGDEQALVEEAGPDDVELSGQVVKVVRLVLRAVFQTGF
jgi:hypothetical protein